MGSAHIICRSALESCRPDTGHAVFCYRVVTYEHNKPGELTSPMVTRVLPCSDTHCVWLQLNCVIARTCDCYVECDAVSFEMIDVRLVKQIEIQEVRLC